MVYLLIEEAQELALFPFELSNLLAGKGKLIVLSPEGRLKEYESWEKIQTSHPTLPLAHSCFERSPFPPFDALYSYLPSEQAGRVRVTGMRFASTVKFYYPLPSAEGKIKGICEFE